MTLLISTQKVQCIAVCFIDLPASRREFYGAVYNKLHFSPAHNDDLKGDSGEYRMAYDLGQSNAPVLYYCTIGVEYSPRYIRFIKGD